MYANFKELSLTDKIIFVLSFAVAILMGCFLLSVMVCLGAFALRLLFGVAVIAAVVYGVQYFKNKN